MDSDPGYQDNVTWNLLSANVSGFNDSAVSQRNPFDLYEAYKTKEREQLNPYKSVAYAFGAVIFLSNLTVVVSSGLILKKGQQPKSTYLLLGNVSLADTIIGISIIFGASVENSSSSDPLCIFQVGMLTCPAIVSIFSVGMIAIDRYIYILHGLYYQRWCNTTKVRICIVCIWMIGVSLGFMPVTGWVNKELVRTKCTYISLFPGMLILINSLLSLVPIILVAVLYTIILVKALKNANKIKATMNTVKVKSDNSPEMRAYRGHGKKNALNHATINRNVVKRSASFEAISAFKPSPLKNHKNMSKSIENVSKIHINDSKVGNGNITADVNKNISDISIFTISTPSTLHELISDMRQSPNKIAKALTNCKTRCKEKIKEPNRWRAVIIVMLTTGSFIFTWLPFFITVIFFVFCEEKLVNPECLDLRVMLRGPIAVLAFCNSIMNPLIYAWWHKRFQRTVRMYFQKYIKRLFVASLPAMGWTGSTFRGYRCWYISVFPPSLLIIVSLMVLSVIIMVCVLYIIILYSAVRTVDRIRDFQERHTVSYINEAFNYNENINPPIHELSTTTITITISSQTITELTLNPITVHELTTIGSENIHETGKLKKNFFKMTRYLCKARTVKNHPSKIRAVKTVFLILFCFVGTWTPYYVAIILYVKCDITRNGYDCIPLELMTLGPLYILGACNSICDPIIYAWRHSGFKRTLRKIFKRFMWNMNVFKV